MTENNNKYKFVCEKCNYKCKFESHWNNHINTELHKTGQRKIRSDLKEPFKCDKCDYKTKNITTLKQHKLNEHSTIEEREKEFKFYCKICDLGSFSKDIFENHNKSEKHIKFMQKINNENI